jgi:hypothetical protein
MTKPILKCPYWAWLCAYERNNIRTKLIILLLLCFLGLFFSLFVSADATSHTSANQSVKGLDAAPCSNWSYVTNIGGVIKYDPAVMASGDRLIITATGDDNAVWTNEFIPAAGLNEWYSLGGYLTSGTSMMQGDDGKIAVSAIGGDNIVWKQIYQSSKNWTKWQSTGSTQLGVLGPSEATVADLLYRVIKKNDNSVEIGRCSDNSPSCGMALSYCVGTGSAACCPGNACSYGNKCCPVGSCGWGENPAGECVPDNGQKDNEGFNGVCRRGLWKTETGGHGCSTNQFPCDDPNDICAENNCVANCTEGVCRITDDCRNWAYIDSLGGQVTSRPIMQKWLNSYIIAVRGMDNNVWIREWSEHNLTDWHMLNGKQTLELPKFSIENDGLWLYIKGTDNIIYKARYSNAGNWLAFAPAGNLDADFKGLRSNVADGYKIYTLGKVVKIGKCINESYPPWIGGQIIYEIAPKEFTSPNGPQTGNFKSLKEKIPYLADLGITGIWLAGYSWSDSHHFFNIWTQYACIRPDVLDPSLGTAQDFRDLTDEAHKYNIKIFLDVITHGVMNNSSLISENPSWFNGGSWRMTDYDWYNAKGDQKDLEQWWIDVWTDYIVNYGVDGFRLDINHDRWDLWAKIRYNAEQANRPILIFPELYDPQGLSKGVYDLYETDKAFLAYDDGIQINTGNTGERKFYMQYISCHDLPNYVLHGSRFSTAYNMFLPGIPLFMSGEEFNNPLNFVPAAGCLYPDENTWCGGLLYASVLQWDKLNESSNKAFFQDFKKIISIRKSEPVLAYYAESLADSNISIINDYNSSVAVPKPYARWHNNSLVMILGNNNETKDAKIYVNFSSVLAKSSVSRDYYILEDLWNGERKTITEADLNDYPIVVASDNFRLLKITSTSPCIPNTCGSLNYSCGSWVNGCEKVIFCGSCQSNQTCSGGGQCIFTTSTTTTLPIQCTLRGNYPPCDEVTLQEVINAINEWAVDEFTLLDVINLINAWAYG